MVVVLASVSVLAVSVRGAQPDPDAQPPTSDADANRRAFVALCGAGERCWVCEVKDETRPEWCVYRKNGE
jgi:hypothetical protein